MALGVETERSLVNSPWTLSHAADVVPRPARHVDAGGSGHGVPGYGVAMGSGWGMGMAKVWGMAMFSRIWPCLAVFGHV